MTVFPLLFRRQVHQHSRPAEQPRRARDRLLPGAAAQPLHHRARRQALLRGGQGQARAHRPRHEPRVQVVVAALRTL